MGVRVPPSAPLKLCPRNVLQDALRRIFDELAFPLLHIQRSTMVRRLTRILLVLAFLVAAVSDSRVRGSQDPKPSSTDFLLQSGAIPIYPPIPRSARMAGTVEIAVTVQRGEVVRTDAKSSAHQMLIDTAVANVKTWKFSIDTNGAFTTRYVYELEPETSKVENARIEMQVPHFVKITARPVVVCFDCGGVNRGRAVR